MTETVIVSNKTNLIEYLKTNVEGETLSIVSMNANPDTYTGPFNSLNFNLNKKINSHFSLGISLRNILKQNKTMHTDSYGAKKRCTDHITLEDFWA